MTNTNTARRAAQMKLNAFLVEHTGVELTPADKVLTDIVNDRLVVCGAPAELQKVAAWAEKLGLVCEIEPVLPDDPDFADWTVARVTLPAGGLS